MFGVFRFILAVMVLITHIGRVEVVAGLAVWGFFMLSGFLMTAVLNRKYGLDAAGIAKFAVSRSIRLFPTYWITILIMGVMILLWGARLDPRLINGALSIPDAPRDIAANLFILGHTVLGIGRISEALSASAWAVDVEILMYVCSCLFLARSKRIALVCLAILAAAYPVLWFAAKRAIAGGNVELAGELTYSFLPAALLPYAIGTCLWFYRNRIPQFLASPFMSFFGWCGLPICALLVSKISVSAAYILSLPCLMIIIAGLAGLKPSPGIRRVDDVFGRLSYPIYLSHWFCAYAVALAAGDRFGLTEPVGAMLGFTASGFFVVLAVTIGVALLFALLVEEPVERIRHSLAKTTPSVPEPAL